MRMPIFLLLTNHSKTLNTPIAQTRARDRVDFLRPLEITTNMLYIYSKMIASWEK